MQLGKLSSEHSVPFRHNQAAGWGQWPWRPDQCLPRYQLAVTQRKEEEPSSSSVFNQNDPWAPTVDFSDFINNETIAGKVSWPGQRAQDEPYFLLGGSLKTTCTSQGWC